MPHILIVEDDEDTRFVYGVLLQMEGYQVTHVGTMAEGLSRALSTSYDLIIMDVRLPDGDGVELCKQIRSFNKVTPVIFVSAAAFEKDVERGMKAGCQAYLTKPASTDELLDKTTYLLGRKAITPPRQDSAILTGLVADAPVAAALIDKDRHYRAVSVAYAAAGGYDATELIGRKATDIFPDVSGKAGPMLETVQQTRQPHFISRYPYMAPAQPELGVTYWDAAMWPSERGEADTDVLRVIRQKGASGDIAASP